MLYSENSACFLLGCLCNKPHLIKDNTFKLTKYDFDQNEVHRFLFVSIKNLALQGLDEIDDIAIDQYLERYPKQHTVVDAGDGFEMIRTMKELANPDTINLYYDTVRKFSILRRFKSKGMDISEIVDETKDISVQSSQLEQYTIDKILNTFDAKFVEIKKEFFIDEATIEYKPDKTTLMALKEQYKEAPAYGSTLPSQYLNRATYGWIAGQLICASGPTGFGKTNFLLSSIAHVCVKQMYDEQQGKFVDNPYYKGAGLIIEFELEPEKEITPKLIGAISGVDARKFKIGDYEDDEEARVERAISIIDESDLFIVKMPNFTMASIESTVKSYVYEHDIKFFVYDYIKEGPALNREISSTSTVKQDTYQVLGALAAFLKQMATVYDIAVMTGTQTNAKLETATIVDEGCIAGARMVADAVDVGLVIQEPPLKDLDETEQFRQQNFGLNNPNMLIHVYKARFGDQPKHLKIWTEKNWGTLKVEDIYCTKYDNMPYQMERIDIQ